MIPADDSTPVETPAPASHTTDPDAHPDPITGEAGAHPVGVGIGAAGAGIAGAVIGMVAGPIGAVIGAAIGAVAGGLAGKEVAAVDDEPLPADTEPVLTAAETSDYDSTGTPTANLTASPEGYVAGSNLGDAGDIAAGQFHDAFTATTLHETAVENQITGDDFGREENVRTAAYFRFLERQESGSPGDAMGDWLDAEQDFR